MSYILKLQQICLYGDYDDGERVKIEGAGLEEPILGNLIDLEPDLIRVQDDIGHTYLINPANVTYVKVKTAEV